LDIARTEPSIQASLPTRHQNSSRRDASQRVGSRRLGAGLLLPCKPARRGSLGGAKSRQAHPKTILSYFLMIITNFLQSTIAEQIVVKPFVAIDL